MSKLKKLQERYLKGEITKAEYTAEVKTLLDTEAIDQEQYDEALEYDVEQERPIYSQRDVDSMILPKAVKLVRKALKDAGVALEADNKSLLSVVAERLKTGSTASEGAGDSEEITALRKQVGQLPALQSRVKDLTIENAVLKEASKYNPVNPVQVVRALCSDYAHMVEVDEETGVVEPKSVARALRRVAEVEPNLFQKTEPDGDTGDGFRGKGPGGGSGSQDDAKYAAKKAEALSMLGLGKKEKE